MKLACDRGSARMRAKVLDRTEVVCNSIVGKIEMPRFCHSDRQALWQSQEPAH